MPAAFKRALGTGLGTSSSTTVTITTTGAIDVGDLVVVRVAADSSSTTAPTITTVADGGNTYTILRQAHSGGANLVGLTAAMAVSKATVARASGSTITVTFSAACAHKAVYAESFTGATNTVRSAAVGAVATGTTSTAASAGASGTVGVGDLVLGMIGNETRGTITGDSDSTNGSWSTQVVARSATSGTDNACISVAGQYKIPTAAGAQTYNVTAVNTDWVIQCAVLQAESPALSTLADTFLTSISVTKWPDSSPAVVWDAGRAKIPVTSSYWALQTGLASGQAYSLTGSGVYAKIVMPANGNNSREVSFNVYAQGGDPQNNVIKFLWQSGNVICRKISNSSVSDVTTFTYNATNHAWLRIREASGTIYWDRSPDGTTWTNITSSTPPSWSLANVAVGFSAGYWGTESASDAFIDYVNALDVAGSATLTHTWATAAAGVTPTAGPGTSARYWRLTWAYERRGVTSTCQAADFQLLVDDIRTPATTVTRISGGTISGGETVNELNDGLMNTKWVETGYDAPASTVIVFDYGTAIAPNGYRWYTGNDAPERDPMSWTLESSPDSSTWTLRDTRTSYAVPTARNALVGPFSLGGALNIYAWQGAAPTATGDTGIYELGTNFIINANVHVTGIRVHSGNTSTYGPRRINVWEPNADFTSATLLTTIDTPDALNGTGPQRIECSLDFPAGSRRALSYQPGENWYRVADGLASAQTTADGAVTIPVAGGRFHTILNTFPDTAFNNTFYGIDFSYTISVPSPLAHWKASSLTAANGDPIGTWQDSTANDLDATATGTARPTYVASGQGGKPALLFDGVDDFFELPDGFSDWTAGLTWYIVAKPTTVTNGGKMLTLSNGADNRIICISRNTTGNQGVFFDTNVGGTTGYFITSSGFFVANTAAIYSMHIPAGAENAGVTGSALRDNLTWGSGGMYVPPTVTRTQNHIAKSPYGGDGFWAGEISEIRVYNVALSPTDHEAVYDELSAEYFAAPSGGFGTAAVTWHSAPAAAGVKPSGLAAGTAAVTWSSTVAAAGPGAALEALYTNDFELLTAGSTFLPAGWTANGGSWIVQASSGVAVQGKTIKPASNSMQMLTGLFATIGTKVRVSCNVRTVVPQLFGPIAMGADDNNFILLEVVLLASGPLGAENAIKLEQRVGGAWAVIDEATSFGFDTTGTRSYELALEIDGDQAVGYVDNVEAVRATLSAGTLAALGKRQGLFAEGSDTAHVGRLAIEMPTAAPVGPPTLTGLTPSSGVSTGGTVVTATGTNFVSGSTTVTIGTDALVPTTVLSPTSLTFTAPGDPAGAVNVTVTTLNGTSTAQTFTYTTPPAGNIGTPPVTSGLVLHLDASFYTGTNGDPVSTWDDQSASNADGTASGTARPAYATGAIGVRPAMRFTPGESDLFNLPAGFANWLSGGTIFVVQKLGTGAGQKPFMLSNGADQRVIAVSYDGGAGQLTVFTTNSSGNAGYFQSGGGSIPVNTAGIVEWEWAAGAADANVASTLLLNGTQIGSGNVYGPPNISRANNGIGYSPYGGDAKLNGDVAAVVVYNRQLNSTERGQVRSWLNTWYFVAPPEPKSGSAAVTYTSTAAAVGKRSPQSAPVVTYASSVTASVGQRTPKASTAVTYVSALTSVGKRITAATATAAHVWSTTAAGVKPIVGAKQGLADAYWIASVTPTGKRSPKALAATTYTEVTTAAGTRALRGTAAVAYTEVTTAAGKRAPKSTLTTTYTATTTAAGKRIQQGSAITTHTWARTAQGVAPIVGVKQGTAAVAWSESVTTSVGKRDPRGAGTTTDVWLTTGAGKRFPVSSATVAWIEALTGVGKRAPKSTVLVSTSQSLTAAGKRSPRSVGTLGAVWSLTAAGVTPLVGVRQGYGVVTYTSTVTAVGKKAPRGSSVVPYVEVLTAVGLTTPLGFRNGSATVTSTWTRTASGKRAPKGTAPTMWLASLAAAGRKAQSGATAPVTNTWALTATGAKRQYSANLVLNIWTVAAVGIKAPRAQASVSASFKVVARGTAAVFAPVEGEFNGMTFNGMQYGDKEVADWLMVPL